MSVINIEEIEHNTAILPKYVLITPARNEAQFIELTIKSVISQTVRPVKWIIVSDGSVDGTDDIVSGYKADHKWIESCRMPERNKRHFAGKVHAFNAGYARLQGVDYDIIGNLDADVSFDRDYFPMLLTKFVENPSLGVGGTAYEERNMNQERSIPTNYRLASIEDVPGTCQLFRRECFEEIGGYRAIEGGNVDSIAVISARIKGWQTKTFDDRTCLHHRASGTAESSGLRAKFKKGVKAYAVGSHPIWTLLRSAYNAAQKPYGIGGAAILSGYLWSLFLHAERPVSREFITFVRREQMQRLHQFQADYFKKLMGMTTDVSVVANKAGADRSIQAIAKRKHDYQ